MSLTDPFGNMNVFDYLTDEDIKNITELANVSVFFYLELIQFFEDDNF